MPVIHNHKGHVGRIEDHVKRDEIDPLLRNAQPLCDYIQAAVRYEPARRKLQNSLQELVNNIKLERELAGTIPAQNSQATQR